MKPIHKFGVSALTGLAIVFAAATQASAEDLNSKVQQQKNEVNEIKSEMEALQKEISGLNNKIKENQNNLDTTKAEIKEIQATIKEKEAAIAALEESIEKRIEILKERASALQQQDRTNIWLDVILNSENITDLLQNVTSLNAIFQSDTDIMQQLENDQATVEAEKEAVAKKEQELLEKQETLEKQKVTLKENEAKKEESLTKLKNKLETAMKNLDATEEQLVAQEAAALFIAEQSDDNSSTSSTRSTSLLIDSASNESSSDNSSNGSNDSSADTDSSNNSTSANSGSVVSIGLSYQGVPYVFGGKSPSGFDCSGFIWYVFNQAGRGIGYQNAAGYYSSSAKVSSPQVGDLVFFSNTYKPGISHVGIYIGGNQFVHAGGSAVQVTSLSNSYWSSHFTGYGRL